MLESALIYNRNVLLWGDEFQHTLKAKHIIVFGIGGVGSYAVESLARTGIGRISLVDFDRVNPTNLNRQIIATAETIGELKTDVMEARIHSINPGIKIYNYPIYFDTAENSEIFKQTPDFVIDAIDTATPKLNLILHCLHNKIPIISSFGAGNRVDPSQLFITDIAETKGLSCPFARKMRNNLKKQGIIKGLPVVVSKEQPIKPDYSVAVNEGGQKEHPPGSTAFVPPAAGLILASYVLRSFLNCYK
jgi:tRNA A37 threonylcarbamoyladenosine dehydratase